MSQSELTEISLISMRERLKSDKRYFEEKLDWSNILVEQWWKGKKWYAGARVVLPTFSLILLVVGLVPYSTDQLSRLEDITKSVLAPSITINGLFIPFFPVITFFFINEIKKYIDTLNYDKEKTINQLKNVKLDNEGNLTLINEFYQFEEMYWHSMSCDILKYVKKYLTYAIFSLVLLVLTFVMLPKIFIVFDFLVLILLVLGIFPILDLALSLKAPYRLQEFTINNKKIKAYAPLNYYYPEKN